MLTALSAQPKPRTTPPASIDQGLAQLLGQTLNLSDTSDVDCCLVPCLQILQLCLESTMPRRLFKNMLLAVRPSISAPRTLNGCILGQKKLEIDRGFNAVGLNTPS